VSVVEWIRGVTTGIGSIGTTIGDMTTTTNIATTCSSSNSGGRMVTTIRWQYSM
jgi:hypothetical protein